MLVLWLKNNGISVMVAEMLRASSQEKGFRIKHVTLYHTGLSQRSQPTHLCAHKLETIHIWGLISVPNQDRGYLQKFSWDLTTHFVHSEGLFQQLENIQQSMPTSSPDPYISNSKSHKRPIQKSLPFRRRNKEHNIPVWVQQKQFEQDFKRSQSLQPPRTRGTQLQFKLGSSSLSSPKAWLSSQVFWGH